MDGAAGAAASAGEGGGIRACDGRMSWPSEAGAASASPAASSVMVESCALKSSGAVYAPVSLEEPTTRRERIGRATPPPQPAPLVPRRPHAAPSRRRSDGARPCSPGQSTGRRHCRRLRTHGDAQREWTRLGRPERLERRSHEALRVVPLARPAAEVISPHPPARLAGAVGLAVGL